MTETKFFPKDTAYRILRAYDEIERADKLRDDILRVGPEHCDLLQRSYRRGIEMGVPSGDSGHRILAVPYQLALTVIDQHVAACRSELATATAEALAFARGESQ